MSPADGPALPDLPLVVVVDDDAAVRDSLAMLLPVAGYRCLAHPSPEALLGAGIPDEAACLVFDLRMPGSMDGVALLEAVRRRGVTVPALVVSGHGDIAQAVRAMRAGAADFIEKPYADTVLLDAIARAIAEARPGSGRRPASDAASARIARLSAREREVLTALAEGLSNKLIAHRLGISARTVEVHRARMMDRLEVRSLGEAVRIAAAAGLVD